MSSPKLILRRLVVDGSLSCDQEFLPGINVVQAVPTGTDPRSTNRCGKTSLIELIQYGLGKQPASRAKFHFAPIIDQLETLWLEFETNDGIFTIERSLNVTNSPIKLHRNSFSPELATSHAESVPPSSLSPLLLRILGIPDVAVSTRDGNEVPLTFPLLIPSFILHQETSFREILADIEVEARRTDIIGFLTGITPSDRFPLERAMVDLRKELDPLENHLREVKRYLAERQVPAVDIAVGLLNDARTQLQAVREELARFQSSILRSEQESDKVRASHIDAVRQRLMETKLNIAQTREAQAALRRETERLQQLMASLRNDERKLTHLQSATLQLSRIDFSMCPRCLRELTPPMRDREEMGRCSLCNRPLLGFSDTLPLRTPSAADVRHQIGELAELIRTSTRELEEKDIDLAALLDEETDLAKQVASLTVNYVSPFVDQLAALASAVADHEVRYQTAEANYRQALGLLDLEKHVAELRTRRAALADSLEKARRAISLRTELLRHTYETILRSVGFPNVNEVGLEPDTLTPLINGQFYTHQGTAFKGLAIVCYHLALFALARAQDCYFPKTLIIDSPNVGDLNEDNYSQLLRYMARLQPADRYSANLDWQIILTTRFLPQELKPFVRDTISAPDRMLLRGRRLSS